MNYDDRSDPTAHEAPELVAGDFRWCDADEADVFSPQPVRVLGVSSNGQMVAVEAVVGAFKGDCWFVSHAALSPLRPVMLTVQVRFEDLLGWLEATPVTGLPLDRQITDTARELIENYEGGR